MQRSESIVMETRNSVGLIFINVISLKFHADMKKIFLAVCFTPFNLIKRVAIRQMLHSKIVIHLLQTSNFYFNE